MKLMWERKFSWIIHLLVQERMHWASAIKAQEKQPFLASKYRDKTLTGFLQTPATWHAPVTASIPALRVPSLILHVFSEKMCFAKWEVILQVAYIYKGFIQIVPDHNCLLRLKRLDFDEPRDCTPLCLYHLVFLWHASTIQIRWQYVTIVTIGLWLLASQQSCQGQFIQQHWLIWQEASYLSLEPGTD